MSLSYGQKTLSPEELHEDFQQFEDALKKRNLGLYLFVDSISFEEHLNGIRKQLNTPKNTLDFFLLLNRAIVPVQERHLSIKGFHKKSDFSLKLKTGEQKLFPLSLLFVNDSNAYIVRNVSTDSTIQLPSSLISINGQSVPRIYHDIEQYITSDYGSTNWTNFELSNTFRKKYLYFIDTTSTYEVKWLDSLQQERIAVVQGIASSELTDTLPAYTKQLYGISKFNPPFFTRYFDDLHTGYIKINSFSKNRQEVDNQVKRFKRNVRDFFCTVNANKYQHVIIDLRNNTGGKISLVQYLLSYIQKDNEKTPIFTSKRKRKFWFGETERETYTMKQKKVPFSGNVYVLTNGGSYSASVMFSVLAKQKADALIVGEEAGGRFNGTTAGRFHHLRLSHSKIVVRIPEVVYTYHIDDEAEDILTPDLEIHPKLRDYFSYESDYQLEQLLDYIRKRNEH